jgi:transcriptional regulator with XRE-family HTH domain
MNSPSIPPNEISRSLYRRSWTDADLAARCGISRSRINQIKNRRVVPTIGEALAIVEALGERLAQVFEDAGASSPNRDAIRGVR